MLVIFTVEVGNIARLFEPKIVYDAKQPKLAGKKRGGAEYIAYRNQNEFGLSESELSEKRRIFEAFFQPGSAYEVFVPSNKLLFDRVMSGNTPASIYKGVSYNPFLVQYGERFDNLDFFSWARRLQQIIPGCRLIVYDAGMYQLINGMDESRLPRKFSGTMASSILEELQTALSSNAEVRDNTELRNRYLKAMLETTGVKGEVVDSRKVLTPDNQDFVDAFQETLEYCRDKSTDNLSISKFVTYKRYGTEFAKSYTPLVIAEALWLYGLGNDAKLGPSTEVEFDSLIRKAMLEQKNAPYLFVWYTRNPKNTQYSDNLFFKDTPEDIRTKLADPEYRKFVGKLIVPFSEFDAGAIAIAGFTGIVGVRFARSLEEKVIALIEEISQRAVS
ncbi:MAG: hypothetical protein AABX25_03110 [Nanoarchaeota archaeon]